MSRETEEFVASSQSLKTIEFLEFLRRSSHLLDGSIGAVDLHRGWYLFRLKTREVKKRDYGFVWNLDRVYVSDDFYDFFLSLVLMMFLLEVGSIPCLPIPILPFLLRFHLYKHLFSRSIEKGEQKDMLCLVY